MLALCVTTETKPLDRLGLVWLDVAALRFAMCVTACVAQKTRTPRVVVVLEVRQLIEPVRMPVVSTRSALFTELAQPVEMKLQRWDSIRNTQL